MVSHHHLVNHSMPLRMSIQIIHDCNVPSAQFESVVYCFVSARLILMFPNMVTHRQQGTPSRSENCVNVAAPIALSRYTQMIQ